MRDRTVKAIVVDGFTATRKVIDGICAEVEVQTANKAFWFKLDEMENLSEAFLSFYRIEKKL